MRKLIFNIIKISIIFYVFSNFTYAKDGEGNWDPETLVLEIEGDVNQDVIENQTALNELLTATLKTFCLQKTGSLQSENNISISTYLSNAGLYVDVNKIKSVLETLNEDDKKCVTSELKSI